MDKSKSRMILDAIEIGRQFSDLREAVRALKEVLQLIMLKAPGYDWNTDPLSITLMVGNALTKSDHVLAGEPDEENDSLQAQLTQRTAELEAAQAIQAIDLKNNNAYREQVANLQAELEAAQQQLSAAQETILRTYTASAAMDLVGVKAELERVRGERDKLALCGHDNSTQWWQVRYEELAALVAALPKVEGEINERFCTGSYYSSPHDYRSHMTFETALVALLKHRQGMEG